MQSVLCSLFGKLFFKNYKSKFSNGVGSANYL